jgi:hypothetical protein
LNFTLEKGEARKKRSLLLAQIGVGRVHDDNQLAIFKKGDGFLTGIDGTISRK